MDLFDEIASQHQPDSYTYAHVMAMCAKRGDLETTLEFFTRSQQSNIPVTKEMGLALVVAYCQNGLLAAQRFQPRASLRAWTLRMAGSSQHVGVESDPRKWHCLDNTRVWSTYRHFSKEPLKGGKCMVTTQLEEWQEKKV